MRRKTKENDVALMVHTGISHFLEEYNLEFSRSLPFDLFRD